MANKMRKFLAWVMVLTLLTGQLVFPAAADTTETSAATVNVTVDVSEVLPEEPAAESQAPAATDSVTVTIAEPVTTTTADSDKGVTEEAASTTTTWSGTEGDTSISGSETTITVTGTDSTTGQDLYEGGTTSGSETTVTTTPEEVVESRTEEGTITNEVLTSQEIIVNAEGSESVTQETTATVNGGWITVYEDTVTGRFTVSERTTETETAPLGEEDIPDDGITIDLALDENASDPDNGSYTFTGTGTGEIIPLEEDMEIPLGAVLELDTNGNIIGYTLNFSSTTITDTSVTEGEVNRDEANSSTDTTGTTSSVTPDLDVATENLNIHIDDNSQITTETDDSGNITAYVITNVTENQTEGVILDELTLPESGTFPQADGSSKTVTVNETQDTDGNRVIQITEVITDANGREISRNEKSQTIIENPIPEAADPITTYTLPQRPVESTTTENGVTITVTVSEIQNDAGELIGYKSTTVKTDADGKELFREENDLYGTEVTTTETVNATNHQISGGCTVVETTVTTNRVTAEETVYEDIAAYNRVNQIVHNMEIANTEEMVQVIDGMLYYIYTGSVTVSEGSEHGDTTLMEPLDILESLFRQNSSLDLEAGGGTLRNVSTSAPEEGYRYIGYGIDTALNISKGNSSSDVIQFRLKGANGEEYYAMCIDFNTTIQSGHMYDIADLTSEDYYQQSGSIDVESAEKIRIIDLNGYWGTEDDSSSADDIGSLDEVKNLLTGYLAAQGNLDAAQIQQIVDSLTPGQALAATQAALWKYGNIDGSKHVNEDNLVPNGWDRIGRDSVKNEDYINTEYVYNALLDLANDPDTTLEEDEGVEFLDAEDITATSIVVKEMVSSADDEENTSNANVYNTDLTFTLGIEPTKLLGDLRVTVYDSNGNEIKTAILASNDTTIFGLRPDENGMYTIPNIEIAEGVSVNLKLHGTQDLGTGVYIYTSLNDSRTDSQTLVTLATGSRKVDLDIEMKLEVQEPAVEKTTSSVTQHGTRTEIQHQTKNDKTIRKSTTTSNEWTQTDTTEIGSEKLYTSDVTLTQVKTTETKTEKNWKFSWIKFFDPEPEEQDDNIPADSPVEPSDDFSSHEPPVNRKVTPKKTMTIEDENVPLAKAPKTGDLSAIWLAVSGLSLGGVALLNKKRKEEAE